MFDKRPKDQGFTAAGPGSMATQQDLFPSVFPEGYFYRLQVCRSGEAGCHRNADGSASHHGSLCPRFMVGEA